MLAWWFGGFVIEDAGVGFVERRWCGFGVGDGFVCGWGGVLGGEFDAVFRMEGIDRIDHAGNGEDWRERWGGHGVLECEGGLDSALPETGEEHEKEA